MELTRALDQISEIHDHLAKGEVFRGYRPLPVAVSGVLAFAAALGQSRILGAFGVAGGPTIPFVFYWAAVAAVGVALSGSRIAWGYFFRDEPFARRRTERVVGQFLPCLFAGAGVTLALLPMGDEWGRLLPGLWSVCFGLGLFASRPYMPRAIGWVALFYLLCGFLLIAFEGEGGPPAWGVGGPFGVGQIAMAGVLYWNLERKETGSLLSGND